MTSCCTNNNNSPTKAVCPVNGQFYSRVSHHTVMHQINQPWQRDLSAKYYYFCDDPDCDVVYFGNDAQVILRDELRQDVGQKSIAPDRPVCYCFDILLTDLQTTQNQLRLREFVTEQTRNATCDCEIRNPSGKCCLQNFPKQ